MDIFQDQLYQKSIEQLVRFAQAAYAVAADNIIFEVFVHKTDSYSEDYRFGRFLQTSFFSRLWVSLPPDPYYAHRDHREWR